MDTRESITNLMVGTYPDPYNQSELVLADLNREVENGTMVPSVASEIWEQYVDRTTGAYGEPIGTLLKVKQLLIDHQNDKELELYIQMLDSATRAIRADLRAMEEEKADLE